MADMLLNLNDLYEYVRAACGDCSMEAAARVQEKMSGEQGRTWRAPTKEELRALDKDGALELQVELLGRKFYMFDASLQPGLEKEILAQAQAIEAELISESGPQSGSGHADTLRERRGVETGLARGFTRNALFERQKAKLLSIRNAEERAAQRMIVPLVNAEQVMKTDCALGCVMPGVKEDGPWLSEFEKNRINYLGVFDGDGKPHALLKLSVQPLGERVLMLSRSASGHFPHLVTNLHISKSMQSANVILSMNSGETGLARTRAGDIVPVNGLPADFISDEPLHISNTGTALDFTSVRKIFGPAGTRTYIRNCPGLNTLGNLEICRNPLHIEDCDNFYDIGALKRVGPVDAVNGAGLTLRNCGNLRSIYGLEEVFGDIDLRGTPVKVMPQSLRKVWGYVHMDSGTYRYLGPSAPTPLTLCHAPKPGSWTP